MNQKRIGKLQIINVIGRFYLIGSNKYDSLFSLKLVGKNGIYSILNDILMLIESI